MLPKTIAHTLLKIGSVSLNPGKPFTYASGLKSPIYCDNRLLISHPNERKQVIDAFLEIIKINDIHFDVVAGTATAGISWAAWIADRLNLPMVYIRSSAKGHGKSNQIEGEIRQGQKVIVIEDLISTGGSSVAAIQALQEKGLFVTACAAIFTYQMAASKISFSKINVPIFTLSNITDLIELASEQGMISNEQMEMILDWIQDPQNWGKKHGFI